MLKRLAITVLGLLGMFSVAQALQAATPAAPRALAVIITDYAFTPQVITVTVGSSVEWYHGGSAQHSVVFTDGSTSGPLNSDDTWTRTFTQTGTFAYHCGFHGSMSGSVVVLPPSGVEADVYVNTVRDGDPTPGGTLRYVLYFGNDSVDFAAQTTTLSVTIPAPASAPSATLDNVPVTPTINGSTLVFALGALAAGTAHQINLDVLLAANLSTSDQLSLTARIAAANPDPSPDNNYSENVVSLPAPDLNLWLHPDVDTSAFVAGERIGYLFEYANLSADALAPAIVFTLVVPAGTTFLSATLEHGETITPIAPGISGNARVFALGSLAAGESGAVHTYFALDANLAAGSAITLSGEIRCTDAELALDNNASSEVQVVSSNAPNVFIELGVSGDGEVHDAVSYRLVYGNRGPQTATNVLIRLALPNGLVGLDWGDTPTPTLRAGAYEWRVPALGPETSAEPLHVSAIISIGAVGTVTATASITHSAIEADPADNTASASSTNETLASPRFALPVGQVVGTNPRFVGLGHPGAQVSLFLSQTVGAPGQLLGIDTVDPDGNWMITASLQSVARGWHWVTATQTFEGRVSTVSGVANYVTDTLSLDTNTILRSGQAMGGFSADLGWSPEHTYTLSVRATACSAPLTPTLTVWHYREDGTQSGYREFAPTQVNTATGEMEFDFATPDRDTYFGITVEYFCPAVVSANALARNSGFIDDGRNFFNCITSLGANCQTPPPPPDPVRNCPDCRAIPRTPPRPRPTDPDGFVHDAVAVRSGARISQAILSNAIVTAVRQIAPGEFVPWNAAEYGQTNPQRTDATYRDGVQTLGYYSFLVPPGEYRIIATAPGYQAYESPTFAVTNALVTLHVPMQRTVGTTQRVALSAPGSSLYLPMVRR